eukprot:CAMPEP_0197004854 /NCGR_PEP_ID=MMETSP1380-20130617/26049_1 /TAXON_ID=5936 /ORGANISM="Euplotes crassus, Strain CT5" /LENGTH=203 /DNA_ID=CAMNT_0042423789 /DNA_START=198 /DNA_END=809 /DNA_ORIENTATION=+
MKKDFSEQSRTEQDYDSDIKIRARVLKVFNKQRNDFKSDAEFDAYTEQVEDIIFNLVEGIDVQETEAKINDYKRINKRNISINSTKKEEERKQKFVKVKENDITLREENRMFYESEEEPEEEKKQTEKSKFELMAEQAKLESEQQEFNSRLFFHKIDSLKLPQVAQKLDPRRYLSESQREMAKKASGHNNKWVLDRSISEMAH